MYVVEESSAEHIFYLHKSW